MEERDRDGLSPPPYFPREYGMAYSEEEGESGLQICTFVTGTLPDDKKVKEEWGQQDGGIGNFRCPSEIQPRRKL